MSHVQRVRAGVTSIRVGARTARYIAVLVIGAGIGALPAAASARPEAVPTAAYRLTAGGYALYEYEALIHQELGYGPLSLCDEGPTCHVGYIYRGDGVSMSLDQIYTFVFATTGQSRFHLMPMGMRFAPGSFGNNPTPVTLNGRVVACNTQATQFLITYGDAAGDANLACLAPGP